jgi:hypothetical protein
MEAYSPVVSFSIATELGFFEQRFFAKSGC